LPGLNNAVRAYRLNLMTAFMREHGYDALALTGADWVEWASNHAVTALSWERPFLLVVSSDGGSFALMPELSRHGTAAEQRRGTLWVERIEYYAESPAAATSGWISTQWHEMVVSSLQTAGLTRARIGADALNDALSSASRLLPELRVSKAGPALRALRWVKHPDEISTMRTCAELSDWAMDAYREELRPGRLLAEVDYLLSAKLAVEAARRLPGENFSIGRLMTLSGSASAAPHGDGAPNGKVLESNAVANTTIVTRLNGMSMELSRPWLVGRADADLQRMFDCARAAQQAGIEAAVAGRAVAGIHSAAQAVFDRAGLGEHLRLRAGHGIGVVMHDFPEDVPFERRPLVEHETYVIEPGLYVSGVGAFRFADAIVVGASEAERLTRCRNTRSTQTLN
jgi:Xaa-Pro aminopeptidase